MDCVLTLSEVDLGYHILYSIYTRDIMDCVLSSSEVDLINTVNNVVTQDLPHSRREHNPSYP
jgi:hypothetical protein